MRKQRFKSMLQVISLSGIVSLSMASSIAARQPDGTSQGDQSTKTEAQSKSESTAKKSDATSDSSGSAKAAQSKDQSKKKNSKAAQSKSDAAQTGNTQQESSSADVQSQFQSATQVMAELMHGKLSPSSSKPGDTIRLKLMQDVKSDGEVLLKKGSTILGVVQKVSAAEGSNSASGDAQSMIQIEWLAPAASGSAQQSLTFMLRSVQQVSPFFQSQQAAANDELSAMGSAGAQSAGSASPPARAPRSNGSNGGLLGSAVGTATQTAGALGAVVQGTGAATAGVTGTLNSTLGANTAGGANGTVNQQTNAAASLFQAQPVDAQTAAMLQHQLGLASSAGLFQIGHGQVITAGGDQHNLNLFSQMNNDTIVTSPSKKFELTSGAQMMMLVGVQKQ